jgi:ADP-ribosylglycohydrolase
MLRPTNVSSGRAKLVASRMAIRAASWLVRFMWKLLRHSRATNRSSKESPQHFNKVLSPQLASLPEREISGSGYVIHCLEASLWCALRAKTYAEGVLAAVNLGDDTDTTGAVTGGLLGLKFGLAGIPQEWQLQLARRNDILALCDQLQTAMNMKSET